MSRLKVSKAMQEVWEWKDACYQEVAHLPTKEALRTLLRNADEAARNLNLGLKPMSSSRPAMVAEERAEYRISSRGLRKNQGFLQSRRKK